MDILKPDLMWIEKRCYRLNFQDSSFKGEVDEQFTDGFAEEDTECPFEEQRDYSEIETIENGTYKTSLSVPRFYFAFVIGSKGVVRRRLESETKTQIRVPKQGQDGYIVITGGTKSGVSAARRRIDLIVMSARQKQQFTHFISVPFIGDSIRKRFVEFKESVLHICKNSRGIDASIFQTPEKLHLTLGTLVIMDAVEREKAAQTLAECKESVIAPLLQNRPLVVCMVGVEYMNDDPAEVDVLYGKVRVKDRSQVLQQIADQVADRFSSKGLMQKQYEQVKLHVTLMNTRFRSEESEPDISGGKRKPRESFDATGILKNFCDFDFGEQTVDSIHLSLRFSTSGSSGYYQATASVSFS
ncbi:activating signal cointegrator 1 complex subunit 1 [Zootermopsis nevadensis]|uniref:Activating signal cointegrator 1 complex subunit 1 n=1 Tax=Zootermopsis nevadensis TaxID=136037 RepID=A0A067QYK4_ZOONE|nr:activating signal cointegrator 1 complex subunit 1 [Zootermopsis nevadensis]KDR15561.1 Activating signal cointegrator 1 complex subunit 1 [Zootermopsis nevadensis]